MSSSNLSPLDIDPGAENAKFQNIKDPENEISSGPQQESNEPTEATEAENSNDEEKNVGLDNGDTASEADSLHSYYVEAIEDHLGEGYIGTRQLTHTLSKANVLKEQQQGNDLFSKLNSNEDFASTEDPHAPPARRRSTVTGMIPTKYHFWSKEFKKYRMNIVVAFLKNYFLLSFFFVVVLALFYGSVYNKNHYYKNLRFLVVNDDIEVDGITPFIGQSIIETIELNTTKTLGTWVVMNHTEITKSAQEHNNNTVLEEINRMLHHQKYWGVVYVHENATLDYVNRIKQNSTISNVQTTFTLSENQSSIDMIYETGRDFLAINQYVHPLLVSFESIYQAVVPSLINEALKSSFSTQEIAGYLQNNPDNILNVPFIKYIDNIPVAEAIMLAPLKIGLLYLVVFSFFQFITTIELHFYIATKISGWGYILYRILIAQVAYLFISLSYVVLNAAFQIKFTNAFGHSGFLVAWAIAFLLMSSLGTVNECAALILFTFFPPMIGFWILILMVANLSVTLSPIILLPKFYRYGYALPVHNAYNAMAVVYFDSWKGKLGFNIGVLLIWIVLSNLALPFIMKWTKSVKDKQDAKAKEEAAAAGKKK